MNTVNLIGRLTKDVELRYTPGKGTAVCNISLAVNKYNASSGKNEAIFIPVVIWGKQAESIANYMTKGCQIAVTGSLDVNAWTDKEGKKHYDTVVFAEKVSFLTFPKKNGDKYSENICPVDDGDMSF